MDWPCLHVLGIPSIGLVNNLDWRNSTVVLSYDEGFNLTNSDGFAANLTFSLFDMEGSTNEPLMSKEACKEDINYILVNCADEKENF